MNKAMLATVLGFGCLAMAGAAWAGPSLNDAWFVKKDARGEAMLADRAACVTEAEQFGVDRATDFSNPEYGSLTALGAALDEDALHGGAKQAVRRAVRDACMQKKGWTRIEVSDVDAKALKKAKPRHAEALDAWLVANADKIPPPPAPKAAAEAARPLPAPALPAPSPVVKTPDPTTPKP